MIPFAFDYAAPRTLREAIELLGSRGEGAKVISGGQSLIPLLKLRLASPALLVDINGIPGLEYIRESDGLLRIGALTRVADLEASEQIKKRHPMIHDASGVIADPLVRNLGTIGGNLSHGDPVNDMPAVMLALDAEFVATGSAGERDIRADGFFVDTFSVGLKQDEILTEVRIPLRPLRSGGAYLKHEQKVADFATAGAAVQVTLDSKGVCTNAGVGLTAMGPTAIKAKEAEEFLRGKTPADPEVVRETARLAVEASDPASDIRGTAAYKKRVANILVTQALMVARHRAGGGK